MIKTVDDKRYRQIGELFLKARARITTDELPGQLYIEVKQC